MTKTHTVFPTTIFQTEVDSNDLLKETLCGQMLEATFEVDHKVELQNGGTNHVDNLWALCPNCHREKGLMNKIQQ